MPDPHRLPPTSVTASAAATATANPSASAAAAAAATAHRAAPALATECTNASKRARSAPQLWHRSEPISKLRSRLVGSQWEWLGPRATSEGAISADGLFTAAQALHSTAHGGGAADSESADGGSVVGAGDGGSSGGGDGGSSRHEAGGAREGGVRGLVELRSNGSVAVSWPTPWAAAVLQVRGANCTPCWALERDGSGDHFLRCRHLWQRGRSVGGERGAR